MPTVEMTIENFEEIVTTNDAVLVDFSASWCSPCKSFAPVYEKSSMVHQDLVFAKVDTEVEQPLAASLDIRSIPALMVFASRCSPSPSPARSRQPPSRI